MRKINKNIKNNNIAFQSIFNSPYKGRQIDKYTPGKSRIALVRLWYKIGESKPDPS